MEGAAALFTIELLPPQPARSRPRGRQQRMRLGRPNCKAGPPQESVAVAIMPAMGGVGEVGRGGVGETLGESFCFLTATAVPGLRPPGGSRRRLSLHKRFCYSLPATCARPPFSGWD